MTAPLRSLGLPGSALAAGLLLVVPAAAQQVPSITAIVAAGSVGNSVSILVANANSFATLRDVDIRVPTGLRHIDNVRIEPRRIEALPPNASEEVTVTFDIGTDVPDRGTRETVIFEVVAAEGILDHPRLALHLGIQTPNNPLAIVPLVVGLKTAEAEQALQRQSLTATVSRDRAPADPALADTVSAQAVAAGSIVEYGTKVGLTAYPPELVVVPRVAGLKVEEATRLVSGVGLRPAVTPLGDAPSEAAAGRVDRSDPAGGKAVAASSSVVLFAYGAWRAPPPQLVPPAGGRSGLVSWTQPWRGEIKLAFVIADGERMSLAQALTRYEDKKPEPKPEPRRPAPGGGPLDATAGAMAGAGAAVAGAIGDAIGDAMAQVMRSVFRMLELGMPVSFTLIEEQGGFRARVPGATAFVDKFNQQIGAIVPVLLPEGGTLLKASRSTSSQNGAERQTVSFELKAAPDWDRLDMVIAIEMAKSVPGGGPRNLRLELTGTARPGLYPADQLERDFQTVLKQAAAMATK